MKVWILYTMNFKHPTRTVKTVVVVAPTEEVAKAAAERKTRIDQKDWQVGSSHDCKDTAVVHEYLS